MTKLQNLFVALVNINISKYGYLSDDIKIKFIHCGLLKKLVLKHYEHIFVYADIQNVCRCIQCLHHLN